MMFKRGELVTYSTYSFTPDKICVIIRSMPEDYVRDVEDTWYEIYLFVTQEYIRVHESRLSTGEGKIGNKVG